MDIQKVGTFFNRRIKIRTLLTITLLLAYPALTISGRYLLERHIRRLVNSCQLGRIRTDIQRHRYIINGGTANVSLSGEVCNYLYLGTSGAGNSGTVEMTGGSLSTNYTYVGHGGTGTFNQSAGTNVVSSKLSLGYGSNGGYNLNGTGQLQASTESVGDFAGTGSFIQSAGTNTITTVLYVGSSSNANGSYDLSETGSLTAPNEYIGYYNIGTFSHSAGTNTVSGRLALGYEHNSNGTYNLSGTGQLNTGWEEVGIMGTGVFVQSGGANIMTHPSIGLTVGRGRRLQRNLYIKQRAIIRTKRVYWFLKHGQFPAVRRKQ